MGMAALYSNIGNLGNIGNSGSTHCLRIIMFFPVTEKICFFKFHFCQEICLNFALQHCSEWTQFWASQHWSPFQCLIQSSTEYNSTVLQYSIQCQKDCTSVGSGLKQGVCSLRRIARGGGGKYCEGERFMAGWCKFSPILKRFLPYLKYGIWHGTWGWGWVRNILE